MKTFQATGIITDKGWPVRQASGAAFQESIGKSNARQQHYSLLDRTLPAFYVSDTRTYGLLGTPLIH